VTISPGFKTPRQIWLQPFPQGNLLRLTNDLDRYGHLSISSDGKTLAAVQTQDSFAISIAPSFKPGQGTGIRSGKSDETGLTSLPDGRILSQKSDAKMTKYKPPGPENTGKMIQCESGVTRTTALNASPARRRTIGMTRAIPYQ
jgi:hypothetical protein